MALFFIKPEERNSNWAMAVRSMFAGLSILTLATASSD